VNRAPFDLAEAESELVAGFHTEYSGLRWSFFFMAEYGSMFAVSGLAAILFFGGWNGPIPITHWLGWAYGPGDTAFHPLGYLANLLGMLNFMFKAVIGVTVMMWVRWTLPRLRIDQVMTTCLKYCTPIAAVTFLGAALWTAGAWPTLASLPRAMGLSTRWGAAPYPAEVREGWLLAAERNARTEAAETAALVRPSAAEAAR
jgi:NADH-quinone oxidoreductase subunit H